MQNVSWINLVNLENYFRRNTPEWPIPCEMDAVLFSLSEVIEFIEAYHLRQNEKYLRTNNRDPEIEKELTQVAMMICTSIVLQSRPIKSVSLSTDQRNVLLFCMAIIKNLIEVLERQIVNATPNIPNEKDSFLLGALTSCIEIADILDVDLAEQLLIEHERIIEKINSQGE